MNRTIFGPILGVLGVILLIVAPFWLGDSPYLMHIAISAFFYAILASSWSLLAGYAGQFSFGHMAFSLATISNLPPRLPTNVQNSRSAASGS